MKFVISMPVWGNTYVKLFTELSLPSQLTGHNLDFLTIQNEVFYYIFTSRKDLKVLRQDESFLKLEKMVCLKIVEIDSFLKNDKYSAWSKCNRISAEKGLYLDCPVFYFHPDVIYSHNVMKKFYECIQKGKRALVFPSLRLDRKKVVDEIFQIQGYKQNGITADQLVKIVLSHFHSETKNLIWNKETISTWPSRIIWRLDQSVYVVKSFHIHPHYIWPEIKILPIDTIDTDYLYQSVRSIDKVEIVKDAKEIAMYELSGFIPFRVGRKSLLKIAFWIKTITNPMQRRTFQKNFYLYQGELKKEKYEKALQAIKVIETKLLKKAEYPKLFEQVYFFYNPLVLSFKKNVKKLLKSLGLSWLILILKRIRSYRFDNEI